VENSRTVVCRDGVIVISVIIRTRNEERWIRPCLEGVLRQQVEQSIEIVLVDNSSSDKTIERARSICPELVLVELSEFLPGHALNEGIRASRGEYIVCLSAHCPPVDKNWLANLLKNLDDDLVAGVYGRQVATSFTSAVDKRDLLLTFGLDRRVQQRDTFFHNANSMMRRYIWEQFPFDEAITNIEDRLWGKAVIEAGYQIVYEPEAAVFHHHGIHQDNRPDRARNVVQIIEENVPDLHPEIFSDPFDPRQLDVVALIPLSSSGAPADSSRRLIAQTIQAAKNAQYINRVFVVADNEEIAKVAIELGAEAPFLRPVGLSGKSIRADEVLKVFLEKLEDTGFIPDVVVPMEVLYPFRPEGLIDGVILHLLTGGFDTVIAGYPEYRPCWRSENGHYEPISTTDEPRFERNPINIGLPSLACATYPTNIRMGNRLLGKVGIYEVTSPLASIEVRTQEQIQILTELIELDAHDIHQRWLNVMGD